MRLTADRLIVVEGERLCVVAVVEIAEVALAAQGGGASLVHQLEDVGFADVVLHRARPAGWPSSAPLVTGLEWPLWLELTPVRAASISRDVLGLFRVVDAWPAPPPVVGLHPYACEGAPPARLPAFLAVFGFAYPELPEAS